MTESDHQEQINNMLKALNVAKVICIDDLYSEATTFEDTSALLESLKSDDVGNVASLRGLNFGDDAEVREQRFKIFWDNLKPNDQQNLHLELEALSKQEAVEDSAALPVLTELFSELGIARFSPSKWAAEKDAVIAAANKDARVLVFCDRDFSKDNAEFRDGIQLIKSITKSDPDNNILCGLISHTFQPSEQYAEWLKIANKARINKARFILISKTLLATESHENRTLFVQAVRRTIVNGLSMRFTHEVSEKLKKTLKVATRKINELNVYDFEQIVFRSSAKEGVWEPETLVRIFSLFQRVETLKVIKTADSIVASADIMRQMISAVPDPPNPEILTARLIHRLELYYGKDELVSLRLPLELGDIFDNGIAQYILLAQPCDLMVRTDKGERSADEGIFAQIRKLSTDSEEPNQQAPAVERAHEEQQQGDLGQQGVPEQIEESAPQSQPTTGAQRFLKNKKQQPQQHLHTLEFFDKDSGDLYVVDFQKRFSVDLSILDLCVFDSDGFVRFTLDQEMGLGLIPAWKKRYSKITGRMKTSINKYTTYKSQITGLSNSQKEEVMKAFIPRLAKKDISETTIVGPTISFGFQRVSRLLQPRSGAMLSSFANFLARHAFEHNIAEN